jgi:hypothetical protein
MLPLVTQELPRASCTPDVPFGGKMGARHWAAAYKTEPGKAGVGYAIPAALPPLPPLKPRPEGTVYVVDGADVDDGHQAYRLSGGLQRHPVRLSGQVAAGVRGIGAGWQGELQLVKKRHGAAAHVAVMR